jgi:dTDP-4-amino-4,6-dideoxygalactose transaminase
LGQSTIILFLIFYFGTPCQTEAKNWDSKVSFVNFNNQEIKKVENTLKVIKEIILSHEFKNRIKHFMFEKKKIFHENNGLTNEEIYQKCLMLRNLGSIEKYKHDIIGRNSRIDTIQSVVLNEKLKYIDNWNEKRNYIANQYISKINNNFIKILKTPDYCLYNTYHIFIIMTEYRDDLINFLKDLNIPTLIHYPIPIELTKAFYNENTNNTKTIEFSNKILSLPMHPFLTDDEINHICESINNFRKI